MFAYVSLVLFSAFRPFLYLSTIFSISLSFALSQCNLLNVLRILQVDPFPQDLPTQHSWDDLHFYLQHTALAQSQRHGSLRR